MTGLYDRYPVCFSKSGDFAERGKLSSIRTDFRLNNITPKEAFDRVVKVSEEAKKAIMTGGGKGINELIF